MILWHPDPPQGFAPEQELTIIGRPVIPRFDSPAGLAAGPPTGEEVVWINDDNEDFVDDFGTEIVFFT